MKKLFLLCKLILFFCVNSCSVPGPDTIRKIDAEKEISLAQLGKAIVCGLDIYSGLVADLGNTKRLESKSYNIIYEKAAVKRCIRAIYAFPCPVPEITPSGRIYEPKLREEFLQALLVTRKMSCDFQPINFLEMKEPFQGRVL